MKELFAFTCTFCTMQTTMLLDSDQYDLWKSGVLFVQDAFPELSEDDRELIMTGTDRKCWDEMFAEEEYSDEAF